MPFQRPHFYNGEEYRIGNQTYWESGVINIIANIHLNCSSTILLTMEQNKKNSHIHLQWAQNKHTGQIVWRLDEKEVEVLYNSKVCEVITIRYNIDLI